MCYLGKTNNLLPPAQKWCDLLPHALRSFFVENLEDGQGHLENELVTCGVEQSWMAFLSPADGKAERGADILERSQGSPLLASCAKGPRENFHTP